MGADDIARAASGRLLAIGKWLAIKAETSPLIHTDYTDRKTNAHHGAGKILLFIGERFFAKQSAISKSNRRMP